MGYYDDYGYTKTKSNQCAKCGSKIKPSGSALQQYCFYCKQQQSTAEAQPAITPVLHMEMLCGHHYCKKPLKLVNVQGNAQKFVYKCAGQHINTIPTEVSGEQVANELTKLNKVLADHTNILQIKAEVLDLKKQKEELEKQIWALEKTHTNPQAPSSK